jgi:hypothetical protein
MNGRNGSPSKPLGSVETRRRRMLGCREGQSCHSPRRAPSRATNLSTYAATKKHEEVASSKGEPLQQCCVSASPSLVEVRGGRADSDELQALSPKIDLGRVDLDEADTLRVSERHRVPVGYVVDDVAARPLRRGRARGEHGDSYTRHDEEGADQAVSQATSS